MSDTPPLVVVIPTKDRRELLTCAIESVQAQTYEPWRAVIVDDGSSDGTATYLAKLREEDSRISVISHAKNRGVNISRNEALRTLRPDEWAVLLDDDDLLLPGALAAIAGGIASAPASYEILFFNTRIVTPHGEFDGGYQFSPGETAHDPTYAEVLAKSGLRGDCKPVIRGSLPEKGYAFSEDVNGFESEFNARVARDGVRMRYLAPQIMRINQAHDFARLSDTAAAREPASFMRVSLRMLREHQALYAAHPALGRDRARSGLRLALRAFDLPRAASFLRAYVRFALTKRAPDEI